MIIVALAEVAQPVRYLLVPTGAVACDTDAAATTASIAIGLLLIILRFGYGSWTARIL